MLALVLAGCGHEEGDGHTHDADNGHRHEKESPSGASFQSGKGVILTAEMRKNLGVETTEATQEKLPQQIRFSVQVFDEKHRHSVSTKEHTGCDVHGSGFLPKSQATLVRPDQSVYVRSATHNDFAGKVLAVHESPVLGEIEVIVGFTNGAAQIKSGDFLSVLISEPRAEAVFTLPASALLRTSEGTFVYALNEDSYYRTAVKIDGEAEGRIAIIEGLPAGAQVVTRPVQTLWLIELRATKGGGHSH